MKRIKLIFVLMITFALFACMGGVASAMTWHVDDDLADYPTANFTRIRDAVNAATDGDTVNVYPGTYYENVNVNKHLTVQSKNGSDSTIVHAANSNDHVFEVTVDYVNISGFTVKGTYFPSDGIYLFYSNYCNISNNNCSNNGDDGIALSGSNSNSISNNKCLNNKEGIRLYHSSNNIISNNNCSSNNWYGIYHLYGSNNNYLSNNNCSSNNLGDIYLFASGNNKLTGNIIEYGIEIEDDSLSAYIHEIDESNKVNGKTVYYWKDVEGGRIPDGAGQVILVNCTNVIVENQFLSGASIKIAFSSFITIKNNNCSNNWAGILLDNSNNNSISNNSCSNNHLGIYLKRSNDNSISYNTGSSNHDGICLYKSSSTIISNNNCSNNKGGCIVLSSSSNNNTITANNANNNDDGISLLYSSNNKIYLNNFINNTDNVYAEGSTNTWNSTSKITYTYNGNTYTNFMGNYWSDYSGNDTNDNGIGDIPYILDSNNDFYPLIDPIVYYLGATL